MSLKVVIPALIAVLALGTIGAGIASSSADSAHDKVWVCHSTASESNPWLLIHVKRSGWLNGHEGPDAHPGHLAEDFLFDDNPDKAAHPHGPAGALQCSDGEPPTTTTMEPTTTTMEPTTTTMEPTTTTAPPNL